MKLNFSNVSSYFSSLFARENTTKQDEIIQCDDEAIEQEQDKPLLSSAFLNAVFGVKQSSIPNDEELKKNLSDYAKIQTDDFYSFLREPEDILEFESAKEIINLLLREKPDSLDQGSYRRILASIPNIQTLTKTNLLPVFVFNEQTFFELNDRTQEGKDYGFENQIYFEQPYFTKPDFDMLKTRMKRREFDVEANMKSACSISEYQDLLSLDDIKNILESSKDLTLQSGSLMKEFYGEKDIYDLPLKFASAVYNKNSKYGGYIKDEMPELFKDVDEKELFEKLDILSNILRGNSYFCCNSGTKIEFSVSDKKYTAECIGKGHEGSVFSISDDKNPSVVMKNYFIDSAFSDANITFAPTGVFGGIGVLREANMAGVSNVPKLYIANPKITPVYTRHTSKFTGGWSIMQNALEHSISKKDTGLDFKDWLNSKGLFLWDDTPDNKINGVYADTGFIVSKARPALYQGGWGDNLANEIYANYLNGSATEDLIKLVDEKIKKTV